MTCLIMCRGLTGAQQVKSLLTNACIGAYMVRPPLHLTGEGCGYAVEVKSERLDKAVEMIKESRLPVRRIFCKDGERYHEVNL